jgi:hypothetical protein
MMHESRTPSLPKSRGQMKDSELGMTRVNACSTLSAILVFVGACQASPAAPIQPNLIFDTADGNAAEIYLSLKDRFKDIPEEITNYMASGEGDPAKLRAAIGRYDTDLMHLERAARTRSCTWMYPEQNRPVAASHLRACLFAATILGARARLKLESGEVDAGLQDLVVLYKLGSDFLLDTPLFPHLVGIRCLCLAYAAVQTPLATLELTTTQLQFLATHAERVQQRYPPFRRSMECEKSLVLGLVDRYIDDPGSLMLEIGGSPGEEPDDTWKMVHRILQVDPEASRRALRRRIEDHWGALCWDAEQPIFSTARRANGEELKMKAVRRLAEYTVLGDPEKGLAGAVDTIVVFTPALEKAKVRHAIGWLVPTLHLMWCRLELYRRERGSFPETLEALGMTTSDPFDGGPLKYRTIQDKNREAFVLTTAGTKKDWEDRIRILAEQSDFDLSRYCRARGDEASADLEYILWSNRPR